MRDSRDRTKKAPLVSLTVRPIGNSLGVILPGNVLELLGVHEAGEKLSLSREPGGEGLRLSFQNQEFERKLAALRSTMSRYKNTLRELAK